MGALARADPPSRRWPNAKDLRRLSERAGRPWDSRQAGSSTADGRDAILDTLAAGWRVHARCFDGRVAYTRSTAKCHHMSELSLETLVWTRGRNMPLSSLRERMMCPRCGNRRVNLIFEPPAVGKRAPVA